MAQVAERCPLALEPSRDAGLVERCKPPTGGATNMLRITDAGQAALDASRRKAA